MKRSKSDTSPEEVINHNWPVVDLRSDTVTKPTEAMYERMRLAKLGDDGLDGDPTAIELEALAADTLGKESALFVPSCTMANLIATLLHLRRNEQAILEADSHMYNAERAGAMLAGAFYLPMSGSMGAMDLNQVEDVIRRNVGQVRTGMIGLETSHNNAGGAVLPLEHMKSVQYLGNRDGIAVHLDGARLFNAAVHLNVPPSQVAQYCDTVSLCLSKGLSAPVGAIFAGDRATVARARVIRRMLGGQQRQVGVVAAAGIEAVTVMGGRLIEDHTRAQELSRVINSLNLAITASYPQTNIVQVDVSTSGRSPVEWVAELKKCGLLVRPWIKKKVRCVLHRHISDGDVEFAGLAFRRAAQALL